MKSNVLNLIGALVIACSASAQSVAPAKVTAWAQHYGGQIVYSYDVENLGASTIKRFLIGRAEQGADLSVAPRSRNETVWLSSDIARSPSGWGSALVYPQESDNFHIEWVEAGYYRQMWPSAPLKEAPIPAPAGGTVGIPPGARATGFSVTVPARDDAYVNGRVTVDVSGDLAVVGLAKGDPTPPVIELEVTRINQNDGRGAWAIFNIRYSASDNFDPAPRTEWLPVTANQPIQASDIEQSKSSASAWTLRVKNEPGRVYTFSARATDASGNSSLKSYRYSVGQ